MNVRTIFKAAGEALVSLVYPAHCAGCGTSVTRGYLCDCCRNGAVKIEQPRCEMCSQPFRGAISGEFSCANCADRKFHFDNAVCVYRSVDLVRELIHRFKYDRQFHLRYPLSEWLAEGLDDPRMRATPVDALVPVPLHAARQRDREFNQARALADLVGGARQVRVADCLRRIRYTSTQTRLDRTERMENLRNAFQMRKHARVQGLRIALVDDVLTTGSTVDECARVLRKAGAASVRVITVARG